jgi:hypothetical protein
VFWQRNCVPFELGRRKTAGGALWQAVALLAMLLLTLPEVARAAHLVLVVHAACPYDGVMVHADEMPSEAVQGDDTPRRGVSVAPEHEHQGCGALTMADRPCTFSLETAPDLASVDFALTPAQGEPAALPPRPVLSYAPKLPPPA